MLDRTVAPAATPINEIKIPLAEKSILANGIPLYSLNIASQEAVKIDLILQSGVVQEDLNGQSFMASKMLLEGTSKLSSSEIAEKLDFYGAFVDISSGFDNFTFTVYTLNKFVKEVLFIVQELLSDSIWPEEEFELAKKIKLQELQINNEKSNIVASKQFRRNLFGSDHPYGTILTASNISELSREDSLSFFQNKLLSSPQIIVSGKVTKEVTETIGDAFGQLQISENPVSSGSLGVLKKNDLVSKDGMQSSIRIGQMSLDRNHKDVHLLSVTNSVFGGYFGSRLMKNIREDKGYTYGIYSSIAHLNEAAFQVISTDVKREFTQNTIDEIFKEIRLLKSEMVGESELRAATNYLLGQFLSSLDSPFNIATKFKSVLLAGVDYQYYYDYLDTLKSVTPDQILETANKYFNEDDLVQVIVGDLS